MNVNQGAAAAGPLRVEGPSLIPQVGPRRLNLGLQGGGSHGAFTWGVLDRLLDGDANLSIEGLSGSSAGAINAVVLADGWIKNGAVGAQQALSDFWSEAGRLTPRGVVVPGEGDSVKLSPASKLFANWAGFFSPTQMNPLGLHPLRDLLVRQIDFASIREQSPFKLFIAATQVSTGKLRIFREHEITVDMLMASTCLPRIHHPVEIEGEAYWDGGYSANPAVFPLIYDCDTCDVLLVLLSPLRRDDAPRSVKEIDDRITELAFNATLMREMQSLAQAAEFSEQSIGTVGVLDSKLRSLRVHMIDISDLAILEGTDSKALAHASFLEKLCNRGRERASLWLESQVQEVGQRSSVDIRRWFA